MMTTKDVNQQPGTAVTKNDRITALLLLPRMLFKRSLTVIALTIARSTTEPPLMFTTKVNNQDHQYIGGSLAHSC